MFLWTTLAVVTLAVGINALALNRSSTVPDECVGEELCHIKPKDYPQEAIDRAVMQNLHYLLRQKRAADLDDEVYPTEEDPDNNCQIIDFTHDRTENYYIKPFELRKSGDMLPKIVIQSGFFEQKFRNIKCKNEKQSCFKKFTYQGPIKTMCYTKKMSYKLHVFNKNTGKIETELYDINTDCACGVPY